MKIYVFMFCTLALLNIMLLACTQPKVAHTNATEPAKSRAPALRLIDSQATAETKALYKNLQKLKGHQMLFGQQDTLAYGFNWSGDADRSDAKDVTGSFVALSGWDLGGLEVAENNNLDHVSFKKIRDGILGVYGRGGVNTISWHMRNPMTGGTQSDKTPAVHELLPGGSMHARFKISLDALVTFNESLKVGGRYIPFIFRPWHEHNGDWFWWGKGNATEENYRALWRFTVHYLRDIKQVHNIIYAFSPDRSRIDLNTFQQDYLYAYPGDDYVDIFGFDNYWDLNRKTNNATEAERLQNFTQSLTAVVTLANTHKKLPALTECGSGQNPRFWTEFLLKGIKANHQSQQIAYMLVWRNPNINHGSAVTSQINVPYPNHESAQDFIHFKQDNFVLFEDELPAMYQ